MLTFIVINESNIIVRATSIEAKNDFEKIIRWGKTKISMKDIGHNHWEFKIFLDKLSSTKQNDLFNLMDNHAVYYH